jgi:hypothetical protein
LRLNRHRADRSAPPGAAGGRSFPDAPPPVRGVRKRIGTTHSAARTSGDQFVSALCFPPGTNFPPSGRSPGRLRPLPQKPRFAAKPSRTLRQSGGSGGRGETWGGGSLPDPTLFTIPAHPAVCSW